MKALFIGVGGAIAVVAKPCQWLELMVLADYNVKRTEEMQKKPGAAKRFPLEFITASKQENTELPVKKYNIDIILDLINSLFNKQIFYTLITSM